MFTPASTVHIATGNEKEALDHARRVADQMAWEKVIELSSAKLPNGRFEPTLIVSRPNLYDGEPQPTQARILAGEKGEPFLYFVASAPDLGSTHEAHWIEDLHGNQKWSADIPR